MILVVRGMWIVALQAITHGRKVDTSLDFIGIFITMALDAKFDWGYCFEVNTGNIIVCTYLVATQAAGCDCRVDGLPLLFIFVTLQTLASIGVLIKADRMLPRHRERGNGSKRQK